MGNDPLDKADPAGAYACGRSLQQGAACSNFTKAQDVAKKQIAAGIKALRGIQETLASGGKLSAPQQEVVSRIDQVIGAGSGTDSKALSSLVSSGEQMLSVLNGNMPAELAAGSSDYAHADVGQLTLFPSFEKSSAQQQAETISHESFHHATGMMDPHKIMRSDNSTIQPYGISSLHEYTQFKAYGPDVMLQVPDAVTIALGVARDD